MSASSAHGWEVRHSRHRSAHRPRDDRAVPEQATPGAPAAGAERTEQPRTWRQRAADAFPMAMVAAICFGLGFSLRAGGASGPAAALPIWTLFLALGCIATLGAGASWVVGGDPTVGPPSTGPALTRARRRAALSAPPRAGGLGDAWGSTEDDELPEMNWEPQVPIMAKNTARHATRAPPPDDPLPDLPGSTAVRDADSHEVIEEIDRLLSDLKPAPARGRPSV